MTVNRKLLEQELKRAGQIRQAAISGEGFDPRGGYGISAFSDERLKENIHKLGESPSGLGIYQFSYIGEESKTPNHIGTMAQEVLKINPDAVSKKDGYYMVDYSKIDVIPYIINKKEYGDK